MLLRVFILLLFAATPAFAQDSSSVCGKISALSPEVFAEGELDHLGKSAALLRWKRIEGASRYFISISRTEDFAKKASFNNWQELLHVRVYPSRTYYWKVTAYDPEKKLISCPQKKPFQFNVDGSGVAPDNSDSIDEEVTEEMPFGEPITDKVAEKTTEVAPAEVPAPAPLEPVEPEETFEENNSPRVSIYTDAGLLQFSQNNAEIGSVNSKGFLFPSLGVMARSPNYGQFFVNAHLQQTTGKFSSIDTGISLVDSQFQWNRYGLKLNYTLSQRWNIYFGLEQITTPYFFALSPTIMTVKAISQNNALLGLTYSIAKTANWIYRMDASFSQALSAKGDGLSTTKISGMMLDYEVNAIHYTPRGLFYGGAVKGFYRKLDETLNSSSFSSNGTATTAYYGLSIFGGMVF